MIRDSYWHLARTCSKRYGMSFFTLVRFMLAGLLFAGTAAEAAQWISHPGAEEGRKPIALQFRNDLSLERVPRRLIARVSADNRYILYVNGRRVDAGPSRGDVAHWRYRRIDIAPYLRRGRNVIAAQVWNDGSFAALAQMSAGTGFLFDAEGMDALDSGPRWRVRVDGSRAVTSGPAQMARTLGPSKYYAAGPPEQHDASRRVDWLGAEPAGGDWRSAIAARAGQSARTLVEDRLPPMRYDRQPGGRLVRAQGLSGARFPTRPLTIPARSTVTLLIDAGRVQAAYPELIVSGGKGAQIGITYAEAMYGTGTDYLRDRGQVEGGRALGLTDSFRPDGGTRTVFQPYWWRVWRFAELRITTGNEPLRLESFARHVTGYPFITKAHFASSDAELNRIWQIGWDTVKLDAHETFMDSAYWEQLQYVGDTRIEALVSYAVGGDARLGAQAVEAFDHSAAEGLTRSRYPSNEPQSIPPFSLLWIGMLHDYWMWQPDPAPVRSSLPLMRSVLEWYRKYVGKNGLVGTTPGWEFIDWRPGLDNYPSTSNPKNTEQCIISLMYIGALRQAADLEDALGDAARGAVARADGARLSAAVREHCWSAERGLFADRPEKETFSQHANVLAILYDVARPEEREDILNRITVRGGGIDAPQGITGTTYYFAFYLARALEHAGLSDRYFDMLRTWRAMLAQHFTTWPETPDPTRSDTHAWSAHPTLDLLTLVAGIRPAAPGFARVRIEPHLGTLTSLDAALAHPRGQTIGVRYRRTDRKLAATISLPAGIEGEFVWKGQRKALRPGMNRLSLAD